VIRVGDTEIASFRGFADKTPTLRDDLSRRDFTVNAIALDLNGTLYDPFSGFQDLQNRVIRFVENPKQRIAEDPCRSIRGCRFVGLLDGVFDEASARGITENVELLNDVAKERFRSELLKIMALSNISKPFIELRRLGALDYILPPLAVCDEAVFDYSLTTANYLTPDKPLLRLVALLHSIGSLSKLDDDRQDAAKHSAELAEALMIDLKFSLAEIRYATKLIAQGDFSRDGSASIAEIRRFAANLKCPLDDFLAFRYASTLAQPNYESLIQHYHQMVKSFEQVQGDGSAITLKELKINGMMLKAMGVQSGPVFSEILNACLNAALNDPTKNNAAYLEDYAKSLIMEKRLTLSE
jgi:tRNA nucleotidyltransferase (CCA-adding enzyme)